MQSFVWSFESARFREKRLETIRLACSREQITQNQNRKPYLDEMGWVEIPVKQKARNQTREPDLAEVGWVVDAPVDYQYRTSL